MTEDWSSHFGIENIPFGIASSSEYPTCQIVSRFQNTVILLADLLKELPEIRRKLPPGISFEESTLNGFAAQGRSAHQSVRSVLQDLIRNGKLPARSLVNIHDMQMHLPVSVGDFTDFSCSEYHNLNAGHAVMGRRGLPPTWGSIPPANVVSEGYAGRCSSIVVSGTPVRRPTGLFWQETATAMTSESREVVHAPCRRMDYELELGAIIGKPLPYGQIVSARDAGDHIFGFVMLNDWSARDIQAFEMIPLGPLNSKNSCTTISPWVLTYDAVEPFRSSSKVNFPRLAPHLRQAANDRALAVDLEVSVLPARNEKSREKTTPSIAGITCRCNSAVMAWSFEQLVAHQASSGCGLRAGDLLAIGTVSDEAEGQRGCLLEDNISALGTSRGFLADGDTVTFSGYCGNGTGFGACVGILLPAMEHVS